MTTLSDRALCFEKQIIEEPTNEALRLVYADYLEDHDENLSRARLIRLQYSIRDMERKGVCNRIPKCDLSLLGRGDTLTYQALLCNRCAIWAQQYDELRALLTFHVEKWLWPINWISCRGYDWPDDPCYVRIHEQDEDAQTTGSTWPDYTIGFGGGFVEEIICDPADWRIYGFLFRERFPIRKVMFKSRPFDLHISGGEYVDVVTEEKRYWQHTLSIKARVTWGNLPPVPIEFRRCIYGREMELNNGPGLVNALSYELRREMRLYLEGYKYLGDRRGWWPGVEFDVPSLAPFQTQSGQTLGNW